MESSKISFAKKFSLEKLFKFFLKITLIRKRHLKSHCWKIFSEIELLKFFGAKFSFLIRFLFLQKSYLINFSCIKCFEQDMHFQKKGWMENFHRFFEMKQAQNTINSFSFSQQNYLIYLLNQNKFPPPLIKFCKEWRENVWSSNFIFLSEFQYEKSFHKDFRWWWWRWEWIFLRSSSG